VRTREPLFKFDRVKLTPTKEGGGWEARRG
jgi:hypothetical protein